MNAHFFQVLCMAMLHMHSSGTIKRGQTPGCSLDCPEIPPQARKNAYNTLPVNFAVLSFLVTDSLSSLCLLSVIRS